MEQAIISIENQRFYEHNGIDVRGIVRALWQDIRSSRSSRGARRSRSSSSRTPMSATSARSGRRCVRRHLRWQLEQRWSKDRILVAYLNTIYFGNGAYGVQQAARTYFNKGASMLKLHEAALLAGLPVDLSVRSGPASEGRWNRRLFVLDDGRTGPHDRSTLPARTPSRSRSRGRPAAGNPGTAPYFVNYVTDQLIAKYGAGRVFGGGLRVTDDHRPALAGPGPHRDREDPGEPGRAQAALVAIDPRDGRVKAMFGGTNFQK